MNPRNERNSAEAFHGDLQHGRGTLPPSCLPNVRYEQGRWFARFGLRIVETIITIVALAAVVAGVIAMFKGVQG